MMAHTVSAMKARIITLVLAITLLSPVLARAADLGTENGFKAAYRQAIEQKDLEQLEALVYWERVPDRFRNVWREQHAVLLGLKILSIELIIGASEQFTKKFTLDGIAYGPNLERTHTLRVNFARNDNGVTLTSVIPVGRKDGRLYITATAPTSK
jgi:hypothetical protein